MHDLHVLNMSGNKLSTKKHSVLAYIECNSRHPVFLGNLQGLLTHALHWVWPLASPEHCGSVAHYCQHADWSITLCHVHWSHLNPHSLCNICQQALQ